MIGSKATLDWSDLILPSHVISQEISVTLPGYFPNKIIYFGFGLRIRHSRHRQRMRFSRIGLAYYCVTMTFDFRIIKTVYSFKHSSTNVPRKLKDFSKIVIIAEGWVDASC